ncbi:RNA polymerase sigma factor [Natronincola ferrireducens]|uniref:RNA polymerase sigma-70 factor, ECF subfamily n=1 Tax=Natronincola ferrireducens TaxID=393762 RepID=A0A1G9GHE2_9FIRM|nr:RNA polymerase sigma factor [Natronincola ferrireducens]SDK99935.1 RNA polymerase sigma-70 factor, ECF subfamily [Natronincola ferrireducens]
MLSVQEVYENYKQDVFYYLISLTHNPALSEDLVSETFLSAIKSLPNFKGDSDIKTWLFSIARYKWYEYLRKKKDDIGLDDMTEIYFSEQLSPLDSMIAKDMYNRVISLLEIHDDKVKGVVMMRIEGYSFYEISLKFGISESSARVIDFRTKKKIREILEKEDLHHE